MESQQATHQDSSLPAPQSAPIQVVLPGQAVGWAAIEKAVRDFDEQQVQDYKEDMDTLLTFAGLFSAALTALLALSYSLLQPDSAGDTVLLLRQIQYQTAPNIHYQGPVMNITDLSPPSPPPFEPSLAAIRVNALWFASLICSLATASIGILVKQWLREYMAVRMTTSAHGRLRVRQFRAPGLDTWKVFEIAASLPLLIQLALALFFIGLCIFTADADPTLGRATLPLVIAWAILFLIVTICPIISARCPYKTPVLIRFLTTSRNQLYLSLYRLIGPSFKYESRTSRIGMMLWSICLSIQKRTSSCAKEHRPYSELDAVTYHDKDLDILASADALQSNDDMLGTVFLDALKQSNLELDIAIAFLRRIVHNRLGLHVNERTWKDHRTWKLGLIDCQSLGRQTTTAIVDMLVHVCDDALIAEASKGFQNRGYAATWVICFLLSFPQDALPISARQLLAKCLMVEGTTRTLAKILCCQTSSSISAPRRLRILLDAICVTCQEMHVSFAGALKYLTDALDIYFIYLRLPPSHALFTGHDNSGYQSNDTWRKHWPHALGSAFAFLSTILSLELRKFQGLSSPEGPTSAAPPGSTGHLSDVRDLRLAVTLTIRLHMMISWFPLPHHLRKRSLVNFDDLAPLRVRLHRPDRPDSPAHDLIADLLTAKIESTSLIEALFLELMHQPFYLIAVFLKSSSFVCDVKALELVHAAVVKLVQYQVSLHEITWSGLSLCYIVAYILHCAAKDSRSRSYKFILTWRRVFNFFGRELWLTAMEHSSAGFQVCHKSCINEILMLVQQMDIGAHGHIQSEASLHWSHSGQRTRSFFSDFFIDTLLHLYPGAHKTLRVRRLRDMDSYVRSVAVQEPLTGLQQPETHGAGDDQSGETAEPSRNLGEVSRTNSIRNSSTFGPAIEHDSSKDVSTRFAEGQEPGGEVDSTIIMTVHRLSKADKETIDTLQNNKDLLGTTLIFLEQSQPKWQDVVVLARKILHTPLNSDQSGHPPIPTLIDCQYLSLSTRIAVVDIIVQYCQGDIFPVLLTPDESEDQDHATWAICILLSISRYTLLPSAFQLLRQSLTNTDILDRLAINLCRAVHSAESLHTLLETVHHVCSAMTEDSSSTFKCFTKVLDGCFSELQLPPSSSPYTVWTSALEIKVDHSLNRYWTVLGNHRFIDSTAMHLVRMLRTDVQNLRGLPRNARAKLVSRTIELAASDESIMYNHIPSQLILVVRLYAMSEWKTPIIAPIPDNEHLFAPALQSLVGELLMAELISASVIESLLLVLMHQRFDTVRRFVRAYLRKESCVFRKPEALCDLDGAIKAVTQHTAPGSEVENILNLCYIVMHIFECCNPVAQARQSTLRSHLFRAWRFIFDRLGRHLKTTGTKTNTLSAAHKFGIDACLLSIQNIDAVNVRYESDYDGYLVWLNTLNPTEILFSDSFVHSLLRLHPDAAVTWRVRRLRRRKPLSSLASIVEVHELEAGWEEGYELLDDEFSLLRRPTRTRILLESSTSLTTSTGSNKREPADSLSGDEDHTSGEEDRTEYTGGSIAALIGVVQSKSASSSARSIGARNSVPTEGESEF